MVCFISFIAVQAEKAGECKGSEAQIFEEN